MGRHSFLQFPEATPTEIDLWWLFRAHAAYRGAMVDLSAAVRAETLGLGRNLLHARMVAQGLTPISEVGIPLTDCRIEEDRALAGAALRQGRDCLLGPLGLASGRDAAEYLEHLPHPVFTSVADLVPWPSRGAPDAPAMPPVADAMFFDHLDRDGFADSVYAVIDGAKVFGLLERLSGSGLRHACLFKGRAESEWGDMAPWLVQLERGHRLTRQLFTRQAPDKPCLWADGAAIILRSPLGLEGLHAHLRRFTMVLQSERNRRMYFRFYDPLTVRTVFPDMPPAHLTSILSGVVCLLAPDPEGAATLIQNMPVHPH